MGTASDWQKYALAGQALLLTSGFVGVFLHSAMILRLLWSVVICVAMVGGLLAFRSYRGMGGPGAPATAGRRSSTLKRTAQFSLAIGVAVFFAGQLVFYSEGEMVGALLMWGGILLFIYGGIALAVAHSKSLDPQKRT